MQYLSFILGVMGLVASAFCFFNNEPIWGVFNLVVALWNLLESVSSV